MNQGVPGPADSRGRRRPAGKPYTDDSIGNALATRELMADQRACGVGGGPPPFSLKGRSRFLAVLERIVRAAKLALDPTRP
mgnify:FL=1